MGTCLLELGVTIRSWAQRNCPTPPHTLSNYTHYWLRQLLAGWLCKCLLAKNSPSVRFVRDSGQCAGAIPKTTKQFCWHWHPTCSCQFGFGSFTPFYHFFSAHKNKGHHLALARTAKSLTVGPSGLKNKGRKILSY